MSPPLRSQRRSHSDHLGDGKPAALLNITRQPGGNTLAIVDSIANLAAGVETDAAAWRGAQTGVRSGALVRDAMASVSRRHDNRRHSGRHRTASVPAPRPNHRDQCFVDSIDARDQRLRHVSGWSDIQPDDAGAMAIAIGLVIDDSVVITENIVRHLRINPNRHEAIRQAVHELIWPVTTSTLTTVVVVSPAFDC